MEMIKTVWLVVMVVLCCSDMTLAIAYSKGMTREDHRRNCLYTLVIDIPYIAFDNSNLKIRRGV